MKKIEDSLRDLQGNIKQNNTLSPRRRKWKEKGKKLT